ncbi:uncharacterized protein LOC118565164 [Fundulus heteroclitus]|uniref:uncharacterized protein LOC118565164 n=1 Tax=Fundulus heteroclitus TaxID=8078 RepID=UPI00165BEFB3|nr:uncharacterized protein LOC118565164 [Fundulus heteroclitus]
MMLPSRLAIIKCNAHRKGNDLIIMGNNAADEAAKLVSKRQMAILAPVVTLEPMVTPEDIILMQQEAGATEHALWAQRGATMSESGLWRSQSGHLVAPVALLTMLISEAHRLDHCGRGKVMEKLKRQGYWSPYMQAMVDEILSQCEICAQNNVRKGIKSPIGHILVPEGPFKHLVIDYVDMRKQVQGKRYMLVVIDRFSRWVEAVPSKTLGADTVIKFLTREVISRFGIPSEISSDNGSAFIQKVLKGVLSKLRIKQRFGAIYHPQSQGIVERINGTLKAKLNKICASTKLNWIDALPLALMSYPMQLHQSTHLTLHEMLTGRTMPVPEWRLPFKGPALEQLQTELKAYMDKLTAIHRAIYLQEKDRSSESVVKRPVKPGDLVYVKVFRLRVPEGHPSPTGQQLLTLGPGKTEVPLGVTIIEMQLQVVVVAQPAPVDPIAADSVVKSPPAAASAVSSVAVPRCLYHYLHDTQLAPRVKLLAAASGAAASVSSTSVAPAAPADPTAAATKPAIAPASAPFAVTASAAAVSAASSFASSLAETSTPPPGPPSAEAESAGTGPPSMPSQTLPLLTRQLELTSPLFPWRVSRIQLLPLFGRVHLLHPGPMRTSYGIYFTGIARTCFLPSLQPKTQFQPSLQPKTQFLPNLSLPCLPLLALLG